DVLRHIECWESGTCAGLVFERLPIQNQANIAAFGILIAFFIEALTCLVTEPYLFQHLADKRREDDIGTLVLDSCSLSFEVFGNVSEDIDTNHIAEAESSG